MLRLAEAEDNYARGVGSLAWTGQLLGALDHFAGGKPLSPIQAVG